MGYFLREDNQPFSCSQFSSSFIKLESSLLCSQKPANGQFPEPAKFSSPLKLYKCKIYFSIIYPPMPNHKMVFSLQKFGQKFCVHFSCFSCVLCIPLYIFDLNIPINISRRARITKLLFMYFFSQGPTISSFVGANFLFNTQFQGPLNLCSSLNVKA